MSTSKSKKSNYLSQPGGSGQGASTASRKGNLAGSVSKSKYGGNTGVYGSTRSRSNVLSSASRKSIAAREAEKAALAGKPPVQVIDEAGNDVTPIPLLGVDHTTVKKNQSNILDSSAGTPTDLMSQASIYNTANVTASTFGGGPFTRSVFSQSQGTGTDSMMGGDDEITEPSSEQTAWADIRHKREEVKETLTDADLEKEVDLTLTETETIWLLDLPTICVSTESDEAASIKKRNETYQELIKSRVGNDRYMERGMNTFNEPPKFKTIQTNKISYNDVGVTATTWDMYDTYEEQDKESKGVQEKEKKDDEGEEEGTISRPTSPKEGEGKEETGSQTNSQDKPALTREGSARARSIIQSRAESRATMSSVAGSESIFASRETGVSSMPTDLTALEEDKILKSDNFKRDLFIMERVINLNTYQPKQACYRGFDIVPDIDNASAAANPTQQISVADMGPNVDRLWAYSCPMTKGRNVSCMTWNKLNPDLIAIGYGQFEFSNQKSGLICCWSLKNPEFPERVYACKEGVTAIDFSRSNPNLLAVGLYDGGVAIYNVKNTQDEPIVDSFHNAGKHTAPVWHIRWIEKERGSGEDRTEVLVSISTDGRVTQWSIRKGFESYDLMRLKRMPTRMGGKKEKKGEAFISRHAGGLCFDFHSRDSNIYIAGTEDGHIHKCSCSYNEQYLDSYTGHNGPVYKMEWSPFVNDIFLSCSADWSIRLWHQERNKPILSFFSLNKSVYDVTWSPRSSTVFACVNEGRVEVWDLSLSTLDPQIVSNPTSGAKQTAVTFAKNSECILVGDSEGQVTVYELRCMPEPPDNQAEALNNLIKASLASQLQSETAEEKEEEDGAEENE
ncbi:WD repeat-containing protein 78-like isoform X1 [Pecten maximus]|uniref:WD repeat-containing protein 78-like isoform X1 n=1 Tax=Pecten maximus TaxID=6579 RepID=UPI001457EB09|nr:WD repeat-containing protein 78-like isoform X1 [Pecten maximus]